MIVLLILDVMWVVWVTTVGGAVSPHTWDNTGTASAGVLPGTITTGTAIDSASLLNRLGLTDFTTYTLYTKTIGIDTTQYGLSDCIEWEDQGIGASQSIPSGTVITSTEGSTTATVTWDTIFENASTGCLNGTVTTPYNDYVVYRSSLVGGDFGVLYMAMDNPVYDTCDKISLTIDFNTPVSDLAFSILDLNYWFPTQSYGYVGGVTIYADGVPIAPDSSLYYLHDAVGIDSTNPNGFAGIAQGGGDDQNIDVFLNGPVQSIHIDFYLTQSGGSNPDLMVLGLSDMCFKTPLALALVPECPPSGIGTYEGYYIGKSDWNLYGFSNNLTTSTSIVDLVDSTGCNTFNHLATDYDRDRLLFTCAQDEFNNLYAVDVTTGTVTDLGQLDPQNVFGSPNGGAVYYNSIYYIYVDEDNFGGQIDRGLYAVYFDGNGNPGLMQKVIDEPKNMTNLGDLAVDENGTLYLLENTLQSTFYTLNLNNISAGWTLINSDAPPGQLFFDDYGRLIGGQSDGSVIQIDPANGTQTGSISNVGQEVVDMAEGGKAHCISSLPHADLSLDKSVDSATALIGDTITFTLTLTNSGPDTATNVTVTDQLPSGFAYLSDSGGGSYDTVTGIWTVGSLDSGSSTVLTIIATVNATRAYTNVAEVTASDQLDPDSWPDNDDGDQSEDDEDNAVVVVPREICGDGIDNDGDGVVDCGGFDCIEWEDQGFSQEQSIPSGTVITSAEGSTTATVTWDTIFKNASTGCLDGTVTTPYNDYVVYNSTPAGGDAGQLYMAMNNPVYDICDKISLTINFNAIVADLAFSIIRLGILDDGFGGTNYVEGVTVYADGVPITTLDSSSYYLHEAVAIDSTNPDGFAGIDIGLGESGNIDVFLKGSVQSIQIDFYLTQSGASNPDNMYLGLSDMCFRTPLIPPTIPACPPSGIGTYEGYYIGQSDWNLYGFSGGSTTSTLIADLADSTGCNELNHLATDYDRDRLLFTCAGSEFNNLYAVDVTTGTVTDLGELDPQNVFGTPKGGAIYYNGVYYIYIDESGTDSGLYAVYFDGNGNPGLVEKVIDGPEVLALGDIAVDDNGILYLLEDVVQAAFYTLDLNNISGGWTLINANAPPGQLFFDDYGRLIIGQNDGWVIEIDPANGTQIDSISNVGQSIIDMAEGGRAHCISSLLTADLSLDKSVDSDTALVGDTITFTLTLTNSGPDTATNVTVTDQLPGGFTYLSDSGGGSYDTATGIWTVGSLDSGSSTVLTIIATVNNTTRNYINVAEVTTSDQLDPDSTPDNDDGDQSEDDEDNAVVAVPEEICDDGIDNDGDGVVDNCGSDCIEWEDQGIGASQSISSGTVITSTGGSTTATVTWDTIFKNASTGCLNGTVTHPLSDYVVYESGFVGGPFRCVIYGYGQPCI